MLFTISVQNHRPPLSGSRFLLFVCLLLTLGACSSRRVIQRRDEPKKEPVEKPKTPTEEVPEEKPAVRMPETIALLMPFQLNKVSNSVPSIKDVDRAALALDFYQGFRLALDELSGKGAYFKLHVLDSRDNVQQVTRLAQSAEVKEAKLVVGPVFPSEVNTFNRMVSGDQKVLQVSPLAASVPDLAHVERFVSVTPTLEMHAAFMAAQVAKSAGPGDQVFFYDLTDADSEKFLLPIEYSLNNKGLTVHTVSSLDDFEMNMRVAGKNFVLCGSTNSFAISPLLAKLTELSSDVGYDIVLLGHPNWARLSDLDASYLSRLKTSITTSFYIDERSSAVRQFKASYQKQFGIGATEYAFKGYDTGVYFGTLMSRYKDALNEQLLEQAGEGISTGFDFKFVEGQGYVNAHVQLLRFDGSEFRPYKGKL